MKCKEIQIRLLGEENISDTEQAHLQDCPHCSQYYQDVHLIRTAITNLHIETPNAMKSSTLMQCRAMLSAKKGFSLAWLRQVWKTNVHSAKTLLGMSLFYLILLFVAAISAMINPKNDLILIFLTLVIIQNTLSALFLPIFLVNLRIDSTQKSPKLQEI